MEKFFLGKKNVSTQVNTIAKYFNIDDNPDIKLKLRHTVALHMKDVYNKYKDNRSNKPIKEFIAVIKLLLLIFSNFERA